MIISRNPNRDISQITKLHLGCGGDFKLDYINVDLYDTSVCDVQDDVIKLEKFPDNFATEIFHQHLLEHLDRAEGLEAIKNWYRVLAQDGWLIFECPDADETFKMWLEMDYHNRWEQTHNLWHGYNMQIWGSQDSEGQQHKIIYDKERIYRILKDIGFASIDVKNINDPWLKQNMHVRAWK
jgi:predicted SAM-dependent methyltransferase